MNQASAITELEDILPIWTQNKIQEECQWLN